MTVATLATRPVTGIAVGDFENGWETLVFDCFEDTGPAKLQPGLCNPEASHPRTGHYIRLA